MRVGYDWQWGRWVVGAIGEYETYDTRDSVSAFSTTPAFYGGLFSCSVGPLPDETMTALDRAAREHIPVRLIFNSHPLLLEMVTLERKDTQRVRIVGAVVGASRVTA